MSMGPHGPWGMGMSPGTRLIRQGADGLDGKRQLPKGLVGRVWREFARPYRARLMLLVAIIAGASSVVVIPPLLFRGIVDAISQPVPDAGRRVTVLALGAVGVAAVAAVLNLGQRYL
jgi:ATP-binding cassette, subfamily B, bacterial